MPLLRKIGRRINSFNERTGQLHTSIMCLPFFTMGLALTLTGLGAPAPYTVMGSIVGVAGLTAVTAIVSLIAISISRAPGRESYIALRHLNLLPQPALSNKPWEGSLRSMSVYKLQREAAASMISIRDARFSKKKKFANDPFIKETIALIHQLAPLSSHLAKTAKFLDSSEINAEDYSSLQRSFEESLVTLEMMTSKLNELAEQSTSALTLNVKESASSLDVKPQGLKEVSEDLISLRSSFRELDSKNAHSAYLLTGRESLKD